MRVSFNESFFKGKTLKEINALYSNAPKEVQEKAEKLWRKVNKKEDKN
jgi:hypothetical protein